MPKTTKKQPKKAKQPPAWEHLGKCVVLLKDKTEEYARTRAGSYDNAVWAVGTVGVLYRPGGVMPHAGKISEARPVVFAAFPQANGDSYFSSLEDGEYRILNPDVAEDAATLAGFLILNGGWLEKIMVFLPG